jgi:hypothetical protein
MLVSSLELERNDAMMAKNVTTKRIVGLQQKKIKEKTVEDENGTHQE